MMNSLLSTTSMLLLALTLLLFWMLIFNGRVDRGKVLIKAAYTLVPVSLALIALNNIPGLTIVLLIPVILEELSKILLSHIYKNKDEAFALVSLFGICEIILSKAPITLWSSPRFSEFVISNIFPILAMAGTVAFMHYNTAAIYAYILRGRPTLQFLICFLIHMSLNLSSYIYIYDARGGSGFNITNIILVGLINFAVTVAISWYVVVRQFSKRTTRTNEEFATTDWTRERHGRHGQ